MKNFYKIVLIILFLLCTMLLSVRAEASDALSENVGERYVITRVSGEFEAYKSSETGSAPAFKSESLAEIVSLIIDESKESSIRFSDILCSEEIVICGGNYNLSGKITFTGNGRIIAEGGEILFSNIVLNFENEGVRLKKGRLIIEESEIKAQKKAIAMDYSSESALMLISGTVSSASADATLFQEYGTVKIHGGTVKNTVGTAIKTSSTLVLVGTPEISGIDCDVLAVSPITLSDNGEEYMGALTLKYDSEFEKGRLGIIAYGASLQNENNIKLIDKLGRYIPVKYYESFSNTSEKNFLTAYQPYEVKFSGNSTEESRYYLYGENVLLPIAPEVSGYKFLGWRIGGKDGEYYEEGLPLSSDIVLFPYYELLAPTFAFLSMEFTYDGTEKYLELSELAHPLLSEGVVSYKWYKNGEELKFYGDRISLKNVSDSGKYKCIFTFLHKSDVVEVKTPEITVTVHKRKIDIPTVPDVEYNGEMRIPEIYSVSLYEALYTPATNAGVYPIQLTVRDAENNGFGEKLESSITINFNILPAQNAWIEEASCRNVYSWQTLVPTATAKFGKVKFYFSQNKDGPYTENPPTLVGNYYLKAAVEANSNYSALVSDAVFFSILEDSVASLHIVSEASKKEYKAFEKFSLSGLSVAARYVSGKEVILENNDITVSYCRENYFLFGDTSVILGYEDKTLPYQISVIKADYDVSGIVFSDCEYEYCAVPLSASFSGELHVGLDGIPLRATVTGGGTVVGLYEIELIFSSESTNYNIPGSIKAKMTILPRSVELMWEKLSFVYDGKLKLPRAYYTDAFGAHIFAEIEGAHSYAGTYKATAILQNPNYKAKNPTEYFVINKASYDLSGVSWTPEKLIYNGLEQRVTLSGLPSGVSVIGYSDNRATNAGKYIASATLSYDSKNYNAPQILPYEWCIFPAEYDESVFLFSDSEFIYDGKEHFPNFSGSLPIGIDGSSPTFTYSGGAVNVSDGTVCVTVSFATGSKNYYPPDSRQYYVRILPRGINVRWKNFSFVYNGCLFSPHAEADECDVAVNGAAIFAGNHTAVAKALDTNYYIINSECEFEILKAENMWSIAPFITDIFASGTLSPVGNAAFGETLYVYSLNKVDLVDAPSYSGNFYFKAVSSGDKNHLPIETEWMEFEIIPVVAVDFFVKMNRTQFLTLEKVTEEDIVAYLINNDSSREEVSISELSVKYTKGDAFSFSDKSITFSCLGFSETKEITVSKRDYDLSDVAWEGIFGVYDGKEKNAYLTGLPEGITVLGYVGNGAINAGSYQVSANLGYDEENYNPPIVPNAVMTVEKQTVVIPDIESVEYTSEIVFPGIESSPIYTYEFSGASKAGSYILTFKLNDSDNYCFDGGHNEVNKSFEITKRRITVRISDIEVYLGGKNSEPSFEIISGEVIEGEKLIPLYEIGDSEICATFDADNYEIEVVTGRVHRNKRFSPEDVKIVIFVFSIVLVGIVSLVIIFINRKKLVSYYSRTFTKNENFIPSMPIEEKREEKSTTENIIESEFSEESLTYTEPDMPIDDGLKFADNEYMEIDANEAIEETEYIANDPTVIDAGYADSVISDSLARSLIRKDVYVETYGNRKEIINVDTLSRSFSAGERVDINLLKRKSLIPYDTGYIKILARGIIDKPLNVYANDFSLSAVKMIALSGGKSIKVGTVSGIKSRDTRKFNKKT